MKCLGYNTQKGLYVDEVSNVPASDVFFEFHEKQGFITQISNHIAGFDFSMEVQSNFGYYGASYLCLSLIHNDKHILNFKKSLHIHKGIHQDSIRYFFFDPDSKRKWDDLSALVLDVYNNGYTKSHIGNIDTFIVTLCEEIDRCSEAIKDSAIERKKSGGLHTFTNDKDAAQINNDVNRITMLVKDVLFYLSKSFLSERQSSYLEHLIDVSIEFVDIINQYYFRAYIDPEYKEIRLLADVLITKRPSIANRLSYIKGRKIDNCSMLFPANRLGLANVYIGRTQFSYPDTICERYVLINNRKDEYLSLNGIVAFDQILASKNPDNSFFTININGDYHIISITDEYKLVEIITQHKYDEIGPFNYGLAPVRLEKKVTKGKKSRSQKSVYGIINSNGVLVEPVKYTYVSDFYKDNSGTVRLDYNGQILQKSLKEISESYSSSLEKRQESKNSGKNIKKTTSVIFSNVGCKYFKRFDNLNSLTLKNLNFIVGPNNCGKSTYIELIELLAHDISLLRNFHNLSQFLAFNAGSNEDGSKIWLNHGLNYLGDEGNKYKYKIFFDAFGKYISHSHWDDAFEISAEVQNILFKFIFAVDLSDHRILDETRSKISIGLPNSQIGFCIYEDKSTIAADVYYHGESKTYHAKEDEGISINRVEEFMKQMVAKIDLIENTASIINEDIDSFFRQLESAMKAATEVKHISVWKGIDLAACRRFVDFEEEQDELMFDAKKTVIIPFINKWLSKMEIGKELSIRNGFGDPKPHHVSVSGKDVRKFHHNSFDCLENLAHLLSNIDVFTEFSSADNIYLNEEKQTLYVTNQDNNKEDILTKGTGAQHFVSLLISICQSMLDNINRNQTLPLLLIEEPEQNLHPRLQSLLVDFLKDVYDVQKKLIKKYSTEVSEEDNELQIIVETHSEYIIRKVQVLVHDKWSDEDVNDKSPFAVFYFPSDPRIAPYYMRFRGSGKFKDRFLPGFFDEANNSLMEIL